MRSLRCVLGLHAWKKEAVRDKGGPYAVYQRCSRCGKDQTPYEPPDQNTILRGSLGGS
jgi:hypothetical protein